MQRIVAVAVFVSLGFSPEAMAEDSPPSADDERRAQVFATVGNIVITVGDIEDEINGRSPYARQRFEDPEIVRQFADDRVRAALLEQGAALLGYANDPDVAAFLDRSILQLFMREEIEGARGVDSITLEEVESYYNGNPDEFRRPEMRRARHILVSSRQEAKELIAELHGTPNKTFGAMAKQRSLDTETKLRGGDLLYFTSDGTTVGSSEDAQVDAALVRAAFALQSKDEIARRPIDLGEGKWSVVQLTAIRPARVESLEDARNGIRRRLWREDRKAALDELLAALRTKLNPTSFPERTDAIVLEAAKGPIQPTNQ